MPTSQEHSEWADHNRIFSGLVRSQHASFCDWAVISLFYSALHWVESYLAELGEHPEGHADRARAFEDHTVLNPIWANYRMLKDYSEDARYRCKNFTSEDVERLEREELLPIRDLVLSHL